MGQTHTQLEIKYLQDGKISEPKEIDIFDFTRYGDPQDRAKLESRH